MVTKFSTGNRYLKLSTDGMVTVNIAQTTPVPVPLDLDVVKIICQETGYCGVIDATKIDEYVGKKIEVFTDLKAYDSRVAELKITEVKVGTKVDVKAEATTKA